MFLNSINNLPTGQTQEIKLRKSNINFRSTTNSLEKEPSEDKFEKERKSTGKKVAIGSVITLAALALIDEIACKGKYRKKLLGKAEEKAGEISDNNPITSQKPSRGFKSEGFKERQKAKRSENVKKAMENKKAQYQKAQRAKLASEGKLDFELKVGEDRIIVKKGEISECYNAHNQKWEIDNNTAPEFVEKIKNSIEKRIEEIIKKS